MKNLKDYIITLIVFIFGSMVAVISSLNSINYNGWPPLLICMSISFIIHWIIFIPSSINKTEKFYDITGTLGYISTLITSSYLAIRLSGEELEIRSIIVILFVLIWALRLGLFLFVRIIKAGEDARFNEVKKVPSQFLIWWSISALWVFLTSANALTMIINNKNLLNDTYLYLGVSIWLVGFSFEVIADEQKRRFNSNPKNKGEFITSGLWSISRHPNYFGEIILWYGIAIITLPTLEGWQYLTLISPIFISLLLIKVSGINLLEQRAESKWGKLDSYKAYKKETSVLIPFI